MLICLLSFSDDTEKLDIEQLYEQYYKELLNITAVKLKEAGDSNYADDAQDVVQNVYYKVVRYRDTVGRIHKNGIKGYLYVIASNEAVNFMNGRKRADKARADFPSGIDDGDFFKMLMIKDRYDRVVECILELDERYSRPMLLCYTYEMSVKEAAQQLGLTEAAVYSRLNTGKRKLLEMLKEKEV